MPRCCLVTAYQGDECAKIAALTLPRMEAYAARHGYELIVQTPDRTDFSNSWMKIPAIISALRGGFDFVVWLDIDALILRTDRNILDDAEPGADLMACWHGPQTVRLDGPSFPPHFNAGVYLIRTSEWSAEFFTRLLAMHGKSDHPWLEQAALLKLLGYNEALGYGPDIPNEQDRAHVARLDPVWNSIPGVAMADDPVIHHFAGLKGPVRFDLIKANADLLPVYETAPAAIRSALSHQISRWAAAERDVHTLRQAAAHGPDTGQTIEIEKLKHDIARLQAPRQMLRSFPRIVSRRFREKIDDLSGVASSTPPFKFTVDDSLRSVQNLRPEGKLERFEGLAFSTSGDTLGVATADTNAVLLYRRRTDGKFEDKPYFRLAGLDYPHDLSFSMCGSDELLAVAQRSGALALFRPNGESSYDSKPVFEISGAETKLTHSDGVSFVPPFNDYLAACNLGTSSISFYRRISTSPVRFSLKPDFELTHLSIFHPDGLAFSQCGRWLAVANHGNATVSIFQRRNRLLAAGQLRYDPEPVVVIDDKSLRYPHSVAFTPRTNHLIVTNAGGNFFSAYAPRQSRFGLQWSKVASQQTSVTDEKVFQATNRENKMEGGPKGLAVHGNTLAVCSPEIGINIYSFEEA